MYKVIGFPKTRAFRVLWMLEELGLDYDVDPVKPRSEEAKAYNPSGKVPVLLVDGEAISIRWRSVSIWPTAMPGSPIPPAR